jgi:hypothetical protein
MVAPQWRQESYQQHQQMPFSFSFSFSLSCQKLTVRISQVFGWKEPEPGKQKGSPVGASHEHDIIRGGCVPFELS